MEKEIKIWFDKEADYLEVMFEVKEGYFKDTKNDAVMIKVDMEGNVIGLSVQAVSKLARPVYLTIDEKDAKVRSLDPEMRKHFKESMKRNESLMKKLAEM